MRLKLNLLRRRNQTGATLIEAIVSMGVFGISFVSLYAGMSMSFSIIGNARENLRATQIMVEKTETIRLFSWDQLNTAGFIPATFSATYSPAGAGAGGGYTTGGGTVATSQLTDTQAGGGLVYNGSVTIAAGPAGYSYSGDMRRINIAMTWTSGSKTHNRSMSTYVSRYGLQNYIY